MSKAPPGFSGGKLLGRSTVEEGRGRREEGWEKKMENEVMKECPAGVPKEADAVGSGVTRNSVPVAQSTTTGEGPLVLSVNLGAGRKDGLNGVVSSLK